ncbi:hypothetical protein Q8A67_000985 [Cirrhinus molitorella]|uniref:Uncharacterized protein n=1 Tax=Cirrhinus molitorella TaxID=172907 RepID=A0AA88QAM4_9TELE|nr:hypothetical protein Q8A67_000985 [Cirrhinus molitorella]
MRPSFDVAAARTQTYSNFAELPLRISQSEDEESIVGEGETKEPFLLVQYSAKGPRVEHKTKLTPNGTESHT